MSSRDMTLNEIKAADKNFGAKHTISVKGFKAGGGSHKGRTTGSKNKMTLAKLASIVEQLTIEMRQGFAQINSRIDNLVSKNNLKE